jgi:resolvase-like protein
MRRTFEVRRETSEQPDGQDRWDRAYQPLLRWAATSAGEQEGVADASGVVRARVHQPPAAGPNHPAAGRPAPQLRRGAQGWTVAEEHVFRDDGYGAKLDRPGLDALRDQAARTAFDVVLVTAPDRLARNSVHQMVVLEELERRGVHVVFIDRPWSDDPP